ncbi:hypothetical protein [Nocardiopsis potens]|uniref:hypothetical protein n=1 Tax=Nocardiopsis potens TaxID=1246458 RepID=UPI00034AA597|nr:hypothetical protein [Nocardiopsis potens]
MGEGLSVVFDADPGADERLVGEVWASAGVEVEGGSPAGEGCASLGTVVARRGGELVGWATLLEPDGRDGEPHVQWALASLEAGLVSGGGAGGPVGEAEVEAVEALVGAAAERARGLGYGGVVWSPGLAEVDEVVAARLGAVVVREEGRDWAVADLSGWAAPGGLPPVRVRRVEEVGEELLEAYARLYADHAVLYPFEQEWDADDVADFLDTSEVEGVREAPVFDVLVGGALVAHLPVLVDADGAAAVGKVVHHGVDAAGLAAGLAGCLESLARGGSAVRSLVVREFDDAVLAGAAERVGMVVAARWPVYRLGV